MIWISAAVAAMLIGMAITVSVITYTQDSGSPCYPGQGKINGQWQC